MKVDMFVERCRNMGCGLEKTKDEGRCLLKYTRDAAQLTRKQPPRP